jgi:hypothetical protein
MTSKLIAATNTVMAEILREAANIIENGTEVIDVDQAIALAVMKLAEQTGQVEVLRSAVTEH